MFGKNGEHARRLPSVFKTWPIFALMLCCPVSILSTLCQQSLEQWSSVDSETASSLSPVNLLEMQIPYPTPGGSTSPPGDSNEHSIEKCWPRG